ncbi:MAG: flavin reductase family protein [Lachnospiraceae bacterium]|nr:flavin reductase family protein [Lachnospiraceae bacterium]
MAKQEWKPGNMLYPLPAVLVTCTDGKGNENVFTVAWAGTVCTNPPMVSISVRPERFSHGMIMETKEFVINLTTEDMAFAVDFCGVRSGRDVDKFEICKLTRTKASRVSPPLLEESPVCIECRVKEVQKLGSHDLFLAEVVAVHAEEAYMDESNRFSLMQAHPLAYSHGGYYGLGKQLGTFGYSVKKPSKGKTKRKKKQ